MTRIGAASAGTAPICGTWTSARLRDRISAVFQDYMTYELSAAENIAVGDLAAGGPAGRPRGRGGAAGIDATLAGAALGL